jgi:hypothetical protein
MTHKKVGRVVHRRVSSDRLAWIRHSWHNGAITPVMAEPIMRELQLVLAYPMVQLSAQQIEQFLVLVINA